jgi:hypothetical protein
MRFNLPMAILMTICVTACNDAKSPDTVDKDVAKAEQKAAVEVAKKEDSAAKDLNVAAAKVEDKIVAFDNVAAKNAYDLAMGNADGDRRIALANCESASGDAQKQCKDQVEADYNAAKAKAEAAAQSQKQ